MVKWNVLVFRSTAVTVNKCSCIDAYLACGCKKSDETPHSNVSVWKVVKVFSRKINKYSDMNSIIKLRKSNRGGGWYGGVGCRGALGGFNHIQTRDTLQGF